MTIDLQALGLSASDLEEKIIDAAADRLLGFEEDDGSREKLASLVHTKCQELAEERIEAFVNEHATAQIETILSSLTFQDTNRYGEPKREPLSLREYIAERTENFLNEKVDWRGYRPDGYSGADQTRVTHLVNELIFNHMRRETEKALKDLNEKVALGIADTIKIQLADALKRLKVRVSK